MSKIDLIKYLPALVYKNNRLPLYITFFVTNRCNLFCEHCFYSASLNQPMSELSAGEIEAMTRTMGSVPVLLYSGGEPFMRKDLVEVTRSFYENCHFKYLSIPTNGMLTRPVEKMTDEICKICPDATIVLNFSIDGQEEEHNRIRGSNKAFAGAMKSYQAVSLLKRKHSNLRTGFGITFTASNQDSIEVLYDFLKKQEPDNISINLIRGTPRDPHVKNIDINKFKKITDRLRKDLENVSLPGYDEFLAVMGRSRYDLIIKTYEEKSFQTICYASRIAGVLYPDGDVYPCELLDKSKMIGNIRDFDMDFRKLWFSQKNRETAEWIVKSKCFCTHECNVHCNTAFNARSFTKIVAGAVVMKAKKILKFH